MSHKAWVISAVSYKSGKGAIDYKFKIGSCLMRQGTVWFDHSRVGKQEYDATYFRIIKAKTRVLFFKRVFI